MRLTVCELPDDAKRRGLAWAELTRYLRTSPTDMLVLPEMPFVEWTVFRTATFDPVVWRQILAEHDTMLFQLSELAAEAVLASRPVEDANQGFAWTRASGYRSSRSKVYLPDGPDGWEATWFDRGSLDPSLLTCDDVRVGFQLCTEMLFTDVSWRLGRAGAQIIAAPRATGGHRRYEGDDFVGQSWIISPEGDISRRPPPTHRSRPWTSISERPHRPRRCTRGISFSRGDGSHDGPVGGRTRARRPRRLRSLALDELGDGHAATEPLHQLVRIELDADRILVERRRVHPGLAFLGGGEVVDL